MIQNTPWHRSKQNTNYCGHFNYEKKKPNIYKPNIFKYKPNSYKYKPNIYNSKKISNLGGGEGALSWSEVLRKCILKVEEDAAISLGTV